MAEVRILPTDFKFNADKINIKKRMPEYRYSSIKVNYLNISPNIEPAHTIKTTPRKKLKIIVDLPKLKDISQSLDIPFSGPSIKRILKPLNTFEVARTNTSSNTD